ncbi:protein MOTHER of FT and TFL1 homolog 2-like [Cynara cardunculus var. scolymus]|uniref:protein MOTHER of FT and TFL1 homolog 2-like n=1 Tax=Cynara cardunculus var. scolymus TaxID=59895 RepID=UPI000D624B54|nr:protein MOTHER of FT and TFL1 homolog 2-like [Cynara cardunculus var. scolymus]
MSSSAYLDALRDVLGGVVEPFVPMITMTVYYGTNKLTNGRELNVSMVKATPRVLIGGNPDELYTLVMIDPDAPNPNEPELKELVSWIVTNIPGGKSCAEGTEFVSYEGPNPHIGIHRYMLILYKQRASLNDIETLESRVHFRVRAFAREHNLGNPVGIAYYNVRRLTKKKTKA